MKEYNEEEFLLLSGIQHYEFCPRQWALIHIEQLWSENLRTIEGKIMHEKAHDPMFTQKRKEIVISRGMPIHSRELGITGVCDIVEFHQSATGIALYGRGELYDVIPVEYKKGHEKETLVDVLQVVGQAMCLEEMFGCNIDKGYLFYGETKRRTEIMITDELRKQVRSDFEVMHQYFERKYVPKVKRRKSCNACSLIDLCLPSLFKSKSVHEYMKQIESEDIFI